MAASNLFSAAECADGVAAALGLSDRDSRSIDVCWQALTVYQGHDTYIVPFHEAGGFMGGVTNQVSREAGRAVQMVMDYCGSWDSQPIEQRSGKDLAEAEHKAQELIRLRLQQFLGRGSGDHQYVVYSFGPAHRRLVRFEGAAGESLLLDDRPIQTQPDGDDLLALLTLPAYGCVVLDRTQPAAVKPDAPLVQVGDSFLENDLLRVEFDLTHGTVKGLIRKTDGRNLLAGDGHTFYLPESQCQKTRDVRISASGPLRGALEFEIELVTERGDTCRIRTHVSLDAHQPLVCFEEHILQCPELHDDQWTNHLGVRFGMAWQRPKLKRSYFNVLEDTEAQHLSSVNLLVAQGPDAEMLFVNHGNQFYVCRDNEIRNILIYENEPCRRFCYAVGCCEDNPVMQARSWVQPCFIQKATGAPEGGSPNRILSSKMSFFSINPPDVELLSCRYVDGRFLLRLANTTDQALDTTVESYCPLGQAFLTDLLGRQLEALRVSDRTVHIRLQPCDVRQLALLPAPHKSKST